MHRPSRAGIILLALALAACGRDTARDTSDDDALAVDSALARDLALATRPAPDFTPSDVPAERARAAAEPAPAVRTERPRATAPRPSPARPTPRRPRPTPAPEPTPAPRDPRPAPEPAPVAATPTPAPAPAPRGNTVAAGTTVGLATNDRVCTNANRVGDKLTATVGGSVIGSGGVAIPSGAKAVLEVASIERGARPEDARITFRVRAIYAGERELPVTGQVAATDQLERTRSTSRGSDAKKVAGGAVLGAILGQVIGKDAKGTVIGAAAGAAAGTAVAKAKETFDGCLPAGAALRLVLGEDVVVE